MKPSKTPRFVHLLILLIAALLTAVPAVSGSKETVTGKTLIIAYSRTGKSMLVAQTLKTQLDADLLEVRDLKDRSGALGYISAGYDAFFDRHTSIAIEPQNADVTPYENIIIVSPIWNWKLSTPIHTFIDQNRFDGKQIIMVTTGNNDIRKYERYDDRAPFLKRFFRDYIRGKSHAVRSSVTARGGYFLKHYHVETLEVPEHEIITKAARHSEHIRNDFSLTVAARERRDAELLRIAGTAELKK